MAVPQTGSDGPFDARRLIADAARELFAGRGYDRTTVDAIAGGPAWDAGRFFRYFRSRTT